MDVAQDADRLARLQKLAAERGLPCFEISSVTGQGIEALKFAMAERVLAPVPPSAAVLPG
jgi:GTP-binding protein